MLKSSLAPLGAGNRGGTCVSHLASRLAPPRHRHQCKTLMMLVRRSVQALPPTLKPEEPVAFLPRFSAASCDFVKRTP
jgi:hypothetical protein